MIIGIMVIKHAKIWLAISFEVLVKLSSSGITRSRIYYNLIGSL